MKFYYFLVSIFVAAYAFMHAATYCLASEDNLDFYDPDLFDDSVSGNELPSVDSDIFFPSDDGFLDNDFFYDDGFSSSISGNDVGFDFSGFDFDFDEIVSILSDIQEYQSYSSYEGVIPEPYYTYMKDILCWSTLSDNYVAFVSSYYYSNRNYNYYVLALGDLSFNGSVFTGSDVDVYEFYPTVTGYSSTNYKHSIQSSFSYVPSGYLCFTDLSSNYPDLRGVSNRYLLVILVVFALVVLFYTFTKFGFGNVTFRRRPRM